MWSAVIDEGGDESAPAGVVDFDAAVDGICAALGYVAVQTGGFSKLRDKKRLGEHVSKRLIHHTAGLERQIERGEIEGDQVVPIGVKH